MYFKYCPIERNELAIRKSDFVRVVELHNSVGESQGFLLVPWEGERVCQMIDAAISRLSGLLCDNLDDVLLRILEAQKSYDVSPVWNSMEYDDPWYDGLQWYETIDEANAEVEKIAEAIARGDRLYDLTKEAATDGK